jgi:hypothetical protein
MERGLHDIGGAELYLLHRVCIVLSRTAAEEKRVVTVYCVLCVVSVMGADIFARTKSA